MAELLDRRTPEKTTGDDAIEERWALVQRVAASHGFQHAKQLREFLLYVAEHALSNDTAEINEYKIGCAVLHRRPDFNPSEDNIVRVQARRLRDKLADYFATDGRDESIVIEIPKGSYIPEFKPRAKITRDPAAPPDAAGGRDLRSGRWRTVSLALMVSVAALIALTIVLWRATPEAARPRMFPGGIERHPVLSAIFSSETPTTLVASDVSLITLVSHLNEKVTLHEYLDPGYPQNVISRIPDEQLRNFLLPAVKVEYVSLTELNVAAQLFELGGEYGADIRVRHAHQMNIRDFDSGNFVVVGTPVSNPWLDLFADDLDYEYDTRSFSLRNRGGTDTEEQYRTTDRGTYRESYVAVGLLPNLTNTGNVLVLSGLAPRAPEAAAKLLFTPDFGAQARAASGAPVEFRIAPHFETLIQVRMVSGTPKSAGIIAIRNLTKTPAR